MTASTFASNTAHTSFASDEKRRLQGKGFLFGDEDDSEVPVREKRGSISGKAASKGGKSKNSTEVEVEEEVIDLEEVGKKEAVR